MEQLSLIVLLPRSEVGIRCCLERKLLQESPREKDDEKKLKFQVSTSKKRYPRGKHTYQYQRVNVTIPTRLFNVIQPYMEEELHIIATSTKDHKLTITITNLAK